MSRIAISQPDWIVFGVRTEGDRVHVYASNELRSINIEMIYDWDEWLTPDRVVEMAHRFRRIELGASLGSFVVVEGSSYADAFSRLHDLFEQWDRDKAANRRALLPPIPALPEGDAG